MCNLLATDVQSQTEGMHSTLPNIWVTYFPLRQILWNDRNRQSKGSSWISKYVRKVKENIYSSPSLFKEMKYITEKRED